MGSGGCHPRVAKTCECRHRIGCERRTRAHNFKRRWATAGTTDAGKWPLKHHESRCLAKPNQWWCSTRFSTSTLILRRKWYLFWCLQALENRGPELLHRICHLRSVDTVIGIPAIDRKFANVHAGYHEQGDRIPEGL